MPNVIEQQICDAIDVLINKRVANLQFDKTVRATIKSIEDASIGKYLVQYQDSSFYAYSDPDKSYKVGAQVYVEIPSSDFNKTKIIIGSVKKLGTEYLTAVSAEQRMTKIGNNILKNKQSIEFCSYDKSPSTKDGVELLTNYIEINEDDFAAYKTDKEYFSIGMTVRTSLPIEQQVGGGNYGIIMQAEYYTTAQRQSLGDERSTVTRTYVLDVNNMLGQPYKYILPEYQYAIFAIDGKNLKGITSIKAFCKGFPIQKDGQPADIFLSNFQVNFMQPLSESQLNTSSLKILTPYGAYFIDKNDDTKYLEAELKLKGKKVSFNDQKVDFYWFVKDTNVTAVDQLHYSPLAGQGWRCLNRAQTYGGLTQFTPQGYRKHITLDMAPAKQTTFKCVAAYEGTTLSATIKIKNKASQTEINITSSAGTKFYFDTGETTLTCNVKTKQSGILLYHWGHRTSDGIFHADDDYTTASFTTPINVADDLVTYECTVYLKKPSGEQSFLGSAQLTLTNGVPQNEYVLVINNGTRIFKYDEYGVSPASNSVDPADRITIPTLSFDIYDDQGRIVTPLNDTDKIKQCDIQWVIPEEKYTMLQWSDALEEDMEYKDIINPTNNNKISRKVLLDHPTFTFSIKNKFDANATDNNIRLEVKFQNHNLVASTNFTFVKQGQTGTNGTKYISRIVPNNSLYTEYYLQNGRIWGWYRQLITSYDPNSGRTTTNQNYIISSNAISGNPFKAQIWDGGTSSLYSSATGDKLWSVLDSIDWDNTDKKFKKQNKNISINPSSGVITPATSYKDVSTVIQSQITSKLYSELAKNYYATYPLTIVTKIPSNRHAIVTGGFKECMYNSDGTRSSFKSAPFTLRIFNTQTKKFESLTTNNISWKVSWDSKQNQTGKNDVTITPPEMYDSEKTNYYIICTYGTSYKIIISVHFYLNRYGMAAMNDWDGTSIKLNNSGDQYILAPQIGAGTKDPSDNSFTGITMGKSFGANGNTSKREIGLMGFSDGARTIFLDADSGRATFGKAGGSQITISPEEYGKAPSGAIYSARYYIQDASGKPTSIRTPGQGMLIDLDAPEIRFGSGNFSVNKYGHLQATGDGHIAGWHITNNRLESDNGETALYSSDSKNRRIRIGKGTATNPDGRFVVYAEGNFSAANNKFTVTPDGTIVATAGHIAGWSIEKEGSSIGKISSDGGKTVLYQNGKIVCDNLIANNVGQIGGWTIDQNELYSTSNKKIHMYSNTGQIKGEHWQINGDGYAKFTHVDITGDDTSTLSWGTDKFNVYSDGSMKATSGFIGDWTINSGLKNSTGSIQFSPGVGIKLGNTFSVTPAGSIKATSGSVGGWGLSGSSITGGETTLNSNGTITCANLIANNSGSIGGWTITSNGLVNGSSKVNSADIQVTGQVTGHTISGTDGSFSNLYLNGKSILDTINESTADKADKGTYHGTCSVYGTIDGIPHTFNGDCTITIG